MFGKALIGKAVAGLVTAGVLAGALTTGVLAAPGGTPSATAAPKAKAAAKARKDLFGGTVTAINDTQLTVKNAKAGSKTFLSTDKTVVVIDGRIARWSEIEVNSHVAVRFSEKDGKLYANRVRIGRVRVAGTVQAVNGNSIMIRTRDGKDLLITVNSNTKYFEITGKKQRQAGQLSDIHAGMRLAAAGRYDASHNFDAAIIAYRNK
ncbi:MAG TPA: DUF5666 domain-containing protein [Candidatus Dormibacteraeota bacterium]